MNRCPRVYRSCAHALHRSHACVGSANRAPTAVTTAGVRAAAHHAGTALPRTADHARPAPRTACRHARGLRWRHRDGLSAAWRRGQTCAASGTGRHRGVQPPGCLTQDVHHLLREPIPPPRMKRGSGTGQPRMIGPVQGAAVETGERCASASLTTSPVPHGHEDACHVVPILVWPRGLPGRSMPGGGHRGPGRHGPRGRVLHGHAPLAASLVSVARWACGRLDRLAIVE
jgi:hypothetical protein